MKRHLRRQLNNSSSAAAKKRPELAQKLQATGAELALFPDHDVQRLGASLTATLASLSEPDPDVRHVHEFRYAAEVAAAIERAGVVRGLQTYIDDALALAKRLIESANSEGKVAGINAQDLALLKELIDLHKFQLSNITLGEYRKALSSAAGAIGGRMQTAINEVA